MNLAKRVTALFFGLGLVLASVPSHACTPTKACGGAEEGYEVWCCGETCNVYTYEYGAAHGHIMQKNVNPGSYC